MVAATSRRPYISDPISSAHNHDLSIHPPLKIKIAAVLVMMHLTLNRILRSQCLINYMGFIKLIKPGCLFFSIQLIKIKRGIDEYLIRFWTVSLQFNINGTVPPAQNISGTGFYNFIKTGNSCRFPIGI